MKRTDSTMKGSVQCCEQTALLLARMPDCARLYAAVLTQVVALRQPHLDH